MLPRQTTHLDKLVSSPSDKLPVIDIHAIDRMCLAAVQLSDLCTIVGLPVPYLPVRARGDDLALVRTIAHHTEHRVCKNDLTTDKTPAE